MKATLSLRVDGRDPVGVCCRHLSVGREPMGVIGCLSPLISAPQRYVAVR